MASAAIAAADRYEVRTIGLPKQESIAWIFDKSANGAACNCTHEDVEALHATISAHRTNGNPCPKCKTVLHVSTRALIGQHNGRELDGDFDAVFFELFSGARDWTAPDKLDPERLYRPKDEIRVIKDQRWIANYRDFGIRQKFVHETGEAPSSTFHLDYDVYVMQGVIDNEEVVPTIVLTNGVPMNKYEWVEVARMVARFGRVVVVSLFGMGESSKPLAFKDASGKWLWSWGLHARMFARFIEMGIPDAWKIFGKVFFGANDWGSGVVQKFLELRSNLLLGAGIYSSIFLNHYWVQQVGGMAALAMLPYPSPTFTAETVRFAGVVTSLLESMYHRSKHHTNQFTLAPLQSTFVEISYDDVNKNPANTIYREHSVRVLAEQASTILGNGELMPYHPTENRNGMRFSRWNAPVHAMHGLEDRMMPSHNLDRLELMMSHLTGNPNNPRLWYRGTKLAKAGHFAIRDQPEKSADEIVSFMRDVVGPNILASPYIGMDGLGRQDETDVMKQLAERHSAWRERHRMKKQ